MSYKVKFTDNTYFHGGNIEDSKWNEIPNKNISKIIYFFKGHRIVLEGYEAYNHVVEHICFIQTGLTVLTPILMVKKGEDVIKIGFNKYTDRFEYNKAKYGREWRGMSHPGWKLGILSNTSIRIEIKYIGGDCILEQ